MACSLKLNFVPFLWIKQCFNTLLTIPSPLPGPYNPSRIPPCFQNKIYIPFFVDPTNSPSSFLATISHSLSIPSTHLTSLVPSCPAHPCSFIQSYIQGSEANAPLYSDGTFSHHSNLHSNIPFSRISPESLRWSGFLISIIALISLY